MLFLKDEKEKNINMNLQIYLDQGCQICSLRASQHTKCSAQHRPLTKQASI